MRRQARKDGRRGGSGDLIEQINEKEKGMKMRSGEG